MAKPAQEWPHLQGAINHNEWQEADPLEYDLLKTNARHNRLEPTEAEAVLWEALRGSALGVKFRRQHIIGTFIVDFVSIAHHLAIEVDGGYHFTSEQQEADAARTKYLERAGYEVVRFTNEQVLFETDEVVRLIEQYLRTP